MDHMYGLTGVDKDEEGTVTDLSNQTRQSQYSRDSSSNGQAPSGREASSAILADYYSSWNNRSNTSPNTYTKDNTFHPGTHGCHKQSTCEAIPTFTPTNEPQHIRESRDDSLLSIVRSMALMQRDFEALLKQQDNFLKYIVTTKQHRVNDGAERFKPTSAEESIWRESSRFWAPSKSPEFMSAIVQQSTLKDPNATMPEFNSLSSGGSPGNKRDPTVTGVMQSADSLRCARPFPSRPKDIGVSVADDYCHVFFTDSK